MTDPIDTPTDAAPAAQPDPITDPPAPADIVEAAADAASRDAYGAGEEVGEPKPDRAQMIAEERAAMKAEAGWPMSAEQLTKAVLILAGAVSMQRISAKVRTAVSDIAGWPRDAPEPVRIELAHRVPQHAIPVGEQREALAAGLADQLGRAQAPGTIKPGQVITEAVLQSVSIDADGLGTIDAMADLEPARWEPSDLVAPGQPVTFGVLAHRDETIIRPEFAALLAEPLRLIPHGVATQELEAPAVPTMEQMVDRGAEALAAVYGPADDWRIMAATVITAVKNLVNGR